MPDNEASFYLGLIGCISLIIGVFAPLISGPFGVTFNYFQGGAGDGIIILAIVFISFILVMIGKYEPLLISAIASLGLTGFTFYQIRENLSYTTGEFGEFGDLAASMIQYQWGWAFLIIGSILLFFSAIKTL